MSRTFVHLFPVWAIALSLCAYKIPAPFIEWKSSIIPLLSIVMFGMGMTLTWHNFRKAVNRPAIIVIAVGIQFLFMPLFAYCISQSFQLSIPQTVGMILVGSSAGGTASNVICYLAKGNVALSILLTMTSTLVSVIATPALTYLYLNQSVPVPFWDMLTSIAQIVFIPVVLGTAINSAFGKHIDSIREIFPLISTFSIVLIIAIIVGINQTTIAQVGVFVVLAVFLHNLGGLGIGYIIPKMLGYDRATCRTISIEVGMQNSGLSVALAVKYFSPVAALPGAIFSIWHNISGALLAGFWGRRVD